MGVVLWLISVLMSLEQGQHFPFCKFWVDVCLLWLETEGLFTRVASGVSDAWNVALPDAVLGLHGSCVLVPCHFTIPKKLQLSCSNRDFWRVRVLDGVGSRDASSQVLNP